MCVDISALLNAVDSISDKIKLMRNELHKIPELAFCEEKTSDYICKKLDEIGVTYKRGVAKTGVVALIEGKNAAKTLLLRADIDALPMQEDKSRANCSLHDGVMHACGHDAHTAVLLGVTEVLWSFRDSLSCNVKLIFQPGEEDTGGALPMIEEGVLDNPKIDAAVALHVMNEVATGKIRVKSGPVMACPDEFDLKIIGKGGHGGYPKECINPVEIASHVVSDFYKLSEEINKPERPVVISVCSINGGTFYNIIPNEVSIRGTVRLYDRELRKKLPHMLEEIIKRNTEKFGAEYEWDYRLMFPPLINDEKMCEEFSDICTDVIGNDNVIKNGTPSMAGDDFAYFAEKVPSVYFNLGSGNKEKGITMPLHAPDFDIDEDCLKTGVLAMCSYALKYGE